MAQLTDQELLDRVREARDQQALGEIVRRYLGFVQASALRQVRDPHLAADIAQAVFIVLVRKADSMRRDAVLPAWLFAVTRHAVANARRVQARRQLHESNKAMMTRDATVEPSDARAELTDQIRHVLDDGIARLPRVERSSLLLHFFESQTHKQIGQT